MTVELLERVDRRADRASPESQWSDVRVIAFEARRDLGRIYKDVKGERDPLPRLYTADARLIRLEQYARRRAAEAAGIEFISPGQELLFPDGCGPDGSAA